MNISPRITATDARLRGRFMMVSCCCCCMVLATVVGGFVYTLLHLSYPHPVPRPAEAHGSGPSFSQSWATGRGAAGSRGRSQQRSIANGIARDFDERRGSRRYNSGN